MNNCKKSCRSLFSIETSVINAMYAIIHITNANSICHCSIIYELLNKRKLFHRKHVK